MANSNTPFGLRPVSTLGSYSTSGAIRVFSVPAGDNAAIFIGDPVKIAGTSQFIGGAVYSDIAQAATGDVICGVVVGVVADTRDSTIYRAASTQRLVMVNIDPNTLYEAQQVSTGTALTANDIGLNINFVVAAGSTVTGLSGVTLDNATEAGTNTLDLKIVGMPLRADNDFGSAVGTGAASSKFYVRINRHLFANQIAGA